MNKNNSIMHIIIWLIAGLTIGAGIYLTKNPACLWAFFFPAVVYINSPESGKNKIINISNGNDTDDENTLLDDDEDEDEY